MKKAIWAVALISVSALISGCGQILGQTSSSTTGSCASGYELSGSSCVAVAATTTTSSTCISIADSIPFYSASADVSGYSLYESSVTVGSSTTVSGTSYTKSNTYGTLALTIPASASGATTLSGTITLPTVTQELIQESASSAGYANSAGTYCVSGMVVEGTVYSSAFSGNVIVYINGTSYGIELYF